MCGIVGVGGPRRLDLIEPLTANLAHRGPDDAATWSDHRLALGHRRLSIIGLDADGRQPRISRSGSSVLVFNGEIYNYLELADELEGEGHQVDRRFDTDILLVALEAWGHQALARLNGMFALAWYQIGPGRVTLARDRWGKKPLFWGRVSLGEGPPTLVFGSELRTFTTLPGGPPEPSPLGVARYLAYGGMPDRQTVYRGVEKVPAAGWVELETDGRLVDRGSYWAFARAPRPTDRSAALDRCEELLLRALALRLRSDVPVGLFLSGGVDSSLLAWAWRRLHPDQVIRTFTVGFEDVSYDERRYAQIMADAIGSEHHEIVVDEAGFAAEIDRVWDHLDEPFADPSLIPTSLVCRHASQVVKVAIGGDGGDEHQAGYDPFRAWNAAKWARRIFGRAAAPLVREFERWSPIADTNLSLRFKLHHFANGLEARPDERVQSWLAPFPPRHALAVMNPDLAREVDLEEVLEPSRRAFVRSQPQHDLSAQIETWVATYLESSILTKVDRASMMHSLEVRAPFLDPDLTAFLATLPNDLVFARGRGKVLLRELGRLRLPPSLADRKKKGFGVPVGRWLRTTLRPRLEACLDRAATDSWYHVPAIRTLWEAHRDRRGEYRQELWAFLFSYPFRQA